MRGFYDQMLPSFVKKYTKKWGAEVKDITMPELEENNTMHAVNVTDAMRESVMQGQPKFSFRPYNGDVAQKRRDIEGIMKTYNIATNIEIAATKGEYTTALRGYGIEDDSIVDSYAAYLEWENKILLNESAIENPFDMAGTIVHENTHRITQTYYKSAIKNLIKQLPLKHLIEYATDELGYNKAKVATNISNISFEVVNEIISTFAEELTITPMEPGGYVLRQYLLGRMSDDNLIEAFEFVENFRYGDKYKPITTSLYPILREVLTTYKNEYERRESG